MQCAVVDDARDDAQLVVAARNGDAGAYAVIFDRWFDRVFDVAVRIVRNRDAAADVAQDTFLHGWRSLDRIEQPASFGGWLLRTSRNRALNRADRERRSVALGDDVTAVEVDRHAPSADIASDELERRETYDLLWAASDALGDRDASVLDLHLRHGLGAAEIAEALDVTANNAHQLLFRLKERLAGALRAWVVWHGGKPACTPLVGALSAAGVTAFGAAAVTVISRHAGGCTACTARQAEMLSPERLFAAAPVIAAGPMLKARAAAALEGQLISATESLPLETAAHTAAGPAAAPTPEPEHRPRSRRRLLASALPWLIAVAVLVTVAAWVTTLTGPRPTLEPVDAPSVHVVATLPETSTSTVTGAEVVPQSRPRPPATRPRPVTTVVTAAPTTVPSPTTTAPPRPTTSTTQFTRAAGGP
jgi:RNA polymerase sigma factor (sigma-70 family)